MEAKRAQNTTGRCHVSRFPTHAQLRAHTHTHTHTRTRTMYRSHPKPFFHCLYLCIARVVGRNDGRGEDRGAAEAGKAQRLERVDCIPRRLGHQPVQLHAGVWLCRHCNGRVRGSKGESRDGRARERGRMVVETT